MRSKANEDQIEDDNEVVEVLLSTYNGSRYLAEQIISVMKQVGPQVRLRVRDDGSSDGTAQIIERFRASNRSMTVDYGVNVGVVRSFFYLLYSVDKNSNYAAFCDQDDVWNSDKLKNAVGFLKNISGDTPAMYCSTTEVVDEALKSIRVPKSIVRLVNIENALVQNIATGCTIVLNRPAIDLLQRRGVNYQTVVMHDWWVYLVIAAFGVVIYDSRPSMQYRQHGNNVVGIHVGFDAMRRRVGRVLNRDRRALIRQASELLRVYGSDMSTYPRELIHRFISGAGAKSWLRRFLYVCHAEVHRQSVLDDVLLRILIVFGRT